MLYLYRRVIYGRLTKDSLMAIADLKPREIVVFAPLIALVFWMGIYPGSFLAAMDASVANLLSHYGFQAQTIANEWFPRDILIAAQRRSRQLHDQRRHLHAASHGDSDRLEARRHPIAVRWRVQAWISG